MDEYAKEYVDNPQERINAILTSGSLCIGDFERNLFSRENIS